MIFRRQGIEAVPDGNGTFTCVQQEEGSDSGQVSRRGVSIGQDSGVFQSYTGAWETGLRNGLGVTNYRNGDIYTGPYVNDKRQGLGKAPIDHFYKCLKDVIPRLILYVTSKWNKEVKCLFYRRYAVGFYIRTTRISKPAPICW